jgi:GNAT superfamily N-acetyltransferase
MRIAPFDHERATGAEQDAWYALMLACHRADQPEYPEPTRHTVLARLASPGPARLRLWVAAEDGGPLLGAVVLVLYADQNAHLATIAPRVHPDARRRGTGRALAETAMEAARAEGRRSVVADSREGSAGDALATALGFTAALAEVNNLLRLAETDRDAVRGWAAGAEARTEGMRLVRWQGHVPAELMDSYLAARGGMDDMPTGELDLAPERPTPEIIREVEDAIAKAGNRLYVVAPQDEATGALAGYTSVHVHPDDPWAEVGSTTVLPAYRGRGLGLWIKAAMIEWMATAEPQLTAYSTGNAAGNVHMRRINDRLGYRVLDSWHAWQRQL